MAAIDAAKITRAMGGSELVLSSARRLSVLTVFSMAVSLSLVGIVPAIS
jgi:hypothetical protein